MDRRAERWPSPLGYVLVPNLLAVIVGFAVFTDSPIGLRFAKLAAVIVSLVGLALILNRLNRHPVPVPNDWKAAWNNVLLVHIVSSIGSMIVILVRIWR